MAHRHDKPSRFQHGHLACEDLPCTHACAHARAHALAGARARDGGSSHFFLGAKNCGCRNRLADDARVRRSARAEEARTARCLLALPEEVGPTSSGPTRALDSPASSSNIASRLRAAPAPAAGGTLALGPQPPALALELERPLA